MGRDTEREAIIGLMTRANGPDGRIGRGAVLLSGEAGIGKTRLALAVAGEVPHSEMVVLRGTPALSEVPFGVLRPLVTRFGAAPETDASRLLAQVHAIARDNPRLVMVVDDVPEIDQWSRAAIAQVVMAQPIGIVMTARTSPRLPDDVADLLDEGWMAQYHVGPLNERDAQDMAERLLGGAIAPFTMSTLVRKSGGSPLFLRELVAAGIFAGGWRRTDRGWVLDDAPASDRLVALLGARFAPLSPGARNLAIVIAAGQPLPAPASAGDSRSLRELQDAGVAVAERDEWGTTLRLAHPIFEDVLRSTTPASTWTAACTEAARALLGRSRQRNETGASDGSDASGDHLRAVGLMLQAGEEVDLHDLLTAAERAHDLLDHAQARALAEAALERDPTNPRAHHLRAVALGSLALPEAEAAFVVAASHACDDAGRALVARDRAAHLYLSDRSPERAIEVLEEAISEIGEPTWRAFVAPELARLQMRQGRQIVIPEPDAETTSSAMVVAEISRAQFDGLMATLGGHFEEVDNAIARATTIVEEHPEMPGGTDIIHNMRGLKVAACVLAGDLPTAVRMTQDGFDTAGQTDPDMMAFGMFTLGSVALHEGDPERSARYQTSALRALAWRDPSGITVAASAVLSSALARMGRMREAREILDRFPPESANDPQGAVHFQETRARLMLADGAPPEHAAHLMAETARTLAENRFYALASLAGGIGLEFGAAPMVVDLLTDAAGQSTGVLAHLFAKDAQATVAGDATALLAVADAAEERYLRPVAIGALTRARACSTVSGGVDVDAIDARILQLSGPVTSAVSPSARLSTREHEIASFAARGASNKAIASGLGLSLRTVENHLFRAYRKLGVSRREDLARALEGRGPAEGGAS